MKAVLIMDMPRECWECDLTCENTSGLTLCKLTGEGLYPMRSKEVRLENCPLRELPEKKREITIDEMCREGYSREEISLEVLRSMVAEGWNACLDNILGK